MMKALLTAGLLAFLSPVFVSSSLSPSDDHPRQRHHHTHHHYSKKPEEENAVDELLELASRDPFALLRRRLNRLQLEEEALSELLEEDDSSSSSRSRRSQEFRMCGRKLLEHVHTTCNGCTQPADSVAVRRKRDVLLSRQKRAGIAELCCANKCTNEMILQLCCAKS